MPLSDQTDQVGSHLDCKAILILCRCVHVTQQVPWNRRWGLGGTEVSKGAGHIGSVFKIVCVCVSSYVYIPHCMTVKSEDIHYIGPRDLIQVSKLSSKYLYPLDLSCWSNSLL